MSTGQPTGSSISGAVHDDIGRPMAGTETVLTGTDVGGRSINLVAETGVDGVYSFVGLRSGTYSIRRSQSRTDDSRSEVVGFQGNPPALGNDEITGIVVTPGSKTTGHNFTVGTGSISGAVHDDLGHPISAVAVILAGTDDAGGTYHMLTRTDQGGIYYFGDLGAGRYAVTQNQHSGYGDGPEQVGSAGGTRAASDTISNIVLSAGQRSVENDFRETTGSISGTVFIDRGNDARADAGELGIAGVTIVLSGADDHGRRIETSAITKADGTYSFGGLVAGDYVVTQQQPIGYIDGQDGAGSVGGDALSANDVISGIVLAGGVDAVGYDFGELDLSIVAGTVFEDRNNDGVKAAAEFGIGGVEIQLVGTTYLGASFSATAITGADGRYLFGSLLPGTYTVSQSQPVGYADGMVMAGNGGGVAGPNRISGIAVGSFTEGFGFDFAELAWSSISGLVVDDFGRPIEGVDIFLSAANGSGGSVADLPPATTDGSGRYVFPDLQPGVYVVREAQPIGYGDGAEFVGSSGGYVEDDVITNVVLPPATNSINNDFQETTGSLSGTVFEDSNSNGQRDDGEMGLTDVAIDVIGTDVHGNTASNSQTTDADGNYSFDGLVGGSYTIYQSQPTTHADGIGSAGSAGGRAYSGSHRITGIVLGGGVDAEGYNFAELAMSSISGSVYDDADNDGARDYGEDGIGDVRVQLSGYDDRGRSVAAVAIADPVDGYTFEGLRPGTYTVSAAQPEDYFDGIDTPGSVGGSGTSDDDQISRISLPAAVDAVGYNFGELRPSSIAGKVSDESGRLVPYVDVVLTGTDDLDEPISLETVSGPDGRYRFTDLRPGIYSIANSPPTGYGGSGVSGASGAEGLDRAAGADDVGGDVGVIVVTLVGGVDSDENNFEATLGSLSGAVFHDRNNNGKRDSWEAGLSPVLVSLTGFDDLGNAVDDITVTDANGAYRFPELVSGTYTVSQTQPNGYLDGFDTPGIDGGRTRVNDEISAIFVAGGVDAVDYDFGELRPSSVSGQVADTAGRPIPDTEINLFGFDDRGQRVSIDVATDDEGGYLFSDLRPGTYSVSSAQPLGFGDGGADVGTSGGEAVGSNTIADIDLAVDVQSVDNNFQDTTGSITGSVFEDLNHDGERQRHRSHPDETLDESGIGGVTVTLSGTDDRGRAVHRSTITNGDGFYGFENLLSGTYTVDQRRPVGYNDGRDSAISDIFLNPGVDLAHHDFGEILLSRIAGTVFDDRSNDGKQSAVEAGITGVSITATGFDDRGEYVESETTTDGDGNYEFSHLRPGVYTVTADQPARYQDGMETAGASGGEAAVANDEIVAIELLPFTDAVGYNFAELRSAVISGLVIDSAGQRLPAVYISLIGTDDFDRVVRHETTTDDFGRYRFSDLRPGEYTVMQLQPDGYGRGSASAGTAGDTSVANVISNLGLSAGTISDDNNFHETMGIIAGNVFNDLNNNGERDGAEPGVENAKLTLTGTDALGNDVRTVASTDGDGNYIFPQLKSGNYAVVETQPLGHLDGIDTPGTAGGWADPVGDEISRIVLAGGELATGYNFAELGPSSIGGRVGVDAYTPINGVEVTLAGADDLGVAVDLMATTDADGGYRFGGLRPGAYTVTETQPAGHRDGADIAGTAGGDSSINDTISAIVVAPATDATGYNFNEAPNRLVGPQFLELNLLELNLLEPSAHELAHDYEQEPELEFFGPELPPLLLEGRIAGGTVLGLSPADGGD